MLTSGLPTRVPDNCVRSLPPHKPTMTRRYASSWTGIALLLVLGLAVPALAQAPRVANALPPSVAASDLALGLAADPVPDTTAPWRYYPLAIGNVWEYGTNHGVEFRREVVADTVLDGRAYFAQVLSTLTYSDGAVRTDTFHVRYDTTTHTVRRWGGEGQDEAPHDVGCPLDSPFDGVVYYEPYNVECQMGGGYDGVLVFGGVEPGTGTDTVRTAVKAFGYFTGVVDRYAADVGLVASVGEESYRALRYYNVGGDEHGEARFPVAAEHGGPGTLGAALDVWPNPSRGPLTVSVQLPTPVSDAEITVYDALGREVARLADGPLEAGRHPLALDGSSLPSGVYVVRLTVSLGGAAPETFARRLTVVR